MRRKDFRGRDMLRILPLALLILATAFLWISGLGRNDWVWPDLMYQGLTGFPGEDKTFTLEEEGYGTLNKGPYYSLPAGEYELEISVESDGGNAVRIVTGNGARVEPAEIALPENSWNLRSTFTLLDDAENLQLQIRFEEGTFLKLHSVSMRTSCTDNLWMLTLVTAALCLLYVLECSGYLTAERKRALVLIGLAVLIASVPALRENLNAGHDSEFHRMRLRNTVSALGEGQFPVRVGGSMYNGYGSATSVFYPDLCFYLPALMMLTGATIQFAMSALIIGINALTAGAMYACARRMFTSREAGVGASVLYLLASYRLTDIYTRMALGEALAMAVIPLFVLGLWEVLFGERTRWPLLTLGAALVFTSHIISTVLCAVLAAVICVCMAGRLVREGRVLPLVKAAVMTALLCAFELVPLLEGMLGGVSMGALNSSVSAAAINPAELFAPAEDFPRDIGAALLILSAAALYLAIGRSDAQARTAKACLCLGAAMALMTTDLFPWAQLERLSGGAVNFLQFPWRLLMFVDLFLALACGWGAARLCREEKLRDAALIGVLAVSVLASSAQISRYAAVDNHPDRYWLSNSHMITAYGEYTLPGSDLARTVTEHEALTGGDAWYSGYEKRGTHVSMRVRAAEGGSITLPVFGFDGYRAELDGQEIAWTLGDNNRLTVEIPENTDGMLCVRFAGKALWRMAEAVSLAAAVFLAVCAARRRKGAQCEKNA